MKEQSKKKFTQKIVDWMKGVDSDMPVVPSPLGSKGGNAWTPEASKLAPKRDAAWKDAEAKQAANDAKTAEYNKKASGRDTMPRHQDSETRASWKQGEAYDNNMKHANKEHADKMKREADRSPPSADMGRRLKEESNAFYNSDKGKAGDTSNHIKMPPEDSPEWIKKYLGRETPAQKSHHTKMAEGGFAHRIGKDAPNREKYIEMGKKFDIKDYYSKQKIQDNIKSVSGSGLTDKEKGIIAGGAAATGGAAAANSYWSRKKEQDRGGK